MQGNEADGIQSPRYCHWIKWNKNCRDTNPKRQAANFLQILPLAIIKQRIRIFSWFQTQSRRRLA